MCNRILILMLDFENMIFFILKLFACMRFCFLLAPHMHAHTTNLTAVPPDQFTTGRKLAVSLLFRQDN